MHLNLYLFGSPRIERNGQPVELNLRKALALLVYVGVTRQSHSRDLLATLFWPDKNQQTARANLRRTLHELGQLLDVPLFEPATDRVTLRADAPLWLDTEQFRRCLAEAPTPGTAAQTLTFLTPLVEAADLYTADFMAGFTLPDCPEFDEWQFFQREELRRSFATLLAQLILTYETEGQWKNALRYARRWLALDPLEEAVHRRLMQLYAQAGQTGAALRQYEECLRILAQELDAPPASETTALYEAIRTRRFPQNQGVGGGEWEVGSATSLPPPPTPHSFTPLLPYSPTPFVGRRQELADLLQRLSDSDCRLLTLVGPGGIGKTRLALEVARLIVDAASAIEIPHSAFPIPHFADGVYFVPLQPVSAPNGIVPAIADALGFQFYSGAPPQEQLLGFLRTKQIMLVLDNFEHLLPGTPLVVELLAGAPGLKMLVTSREALKLAEEWFHPLAGMRLPPIANLQTPGAESEPRQPAGEIASYDAVHLFLQTARRTVVDFQPDTQQEQIVRICRLVDGMPLGIVLAASWLKVLSCAQIAQEIERGVDILVTRHQNMPERHRNMRVVLEQSWQLHAAQTQQVLKQLSVFRGGFLNEAAAAVAGANLLTLADLVDTAWIYRAPDGHYQMHELLRQFAAERLAEEPANEDTARDRHAAYYLQQIARLEPALIGPEQRAALDEIGAEIDNVQAAWSRAAQQRSINLIDKALQGIYEFFFLRSRYTEGEELFSHALRQFKEREPGDERVDYTQINNRLLARLGVFRLYQGDLAGADAYFEPLLSHSDDVRELAFIYARLGSSARLRGDRAAAEVALQQSLALAHASGDRNLVAEALHVLSDVAATFSDFAAAERFARDALALCRDLQRPELTARALVALAWATNCLGAYAESEQYYQESLVIAEAIGNPYGIALATNFLGWCAYAAGGDRLVEALSLFERSLVIWRQIGQRTNLAMCCGDYALAASEFGEDATALRYAQEGLSYTEELDHRDLTAYILCTLGSAACGLDDLEASRGYLFRSLQISIAAQLPDKVSLALYFLSRLLVTESRQSHHAESERLQKEVQALKLLAWVIHQPVTWQLIRDRAQRVQAELAERLPPEIVAAANEWGKYKTLAEAAAEVLSEAAADWPG